MTARIVPFPANAGQDRDEVEILLRKWLAELSPDSRFVNGVTERMLSFINNYASKTFEPAFNLAAPANMSEQEAAALLQSIEQGVGQSAREVQEMINRIIVERFLLEVELYNMRNNKTRPQKLL